MSSEDVKRVKSEASKDENDDKSLSSILQNKNKKPDRNKPSTAKSLSLKDSKKKLGSKLKKEEESDEDFTPKEKTRIDAKPMKEESASAETKKTPITKVKKRKLEMLTNMKKTPNSDVKKEKAGNSYKEAMLCLKDEQAESPNLMIEDQKLDEVLVTRRGHKKGWSRVVRGSSSSCQYQPTTQIYVDHEVRTYMANLVEILRSRGFNDLPIPPSPFQPMAQSCVDHELRAYIANLYEILRSQGIDDLPIPPPPFPC